MLARPRQLRLEVFTSLNNGEERFGRRKWSKPWNIFVMVGFPANLLHLTANSARVIMTICASGRPILYYIIASQVYMRTWSACKPSLTGGLVIDFQYCAKFRSALLSTGVLRVHFPSHLLTWKKHILSITHNGIRLNTLFCKSLIKCWTSISQAGRLLLGMSWSAKRFRQSRLACASVSPFIPWFICIWRERWSSEPTTG